MHKQYQWCLNLNVFISQQSLQNETISQANLMGNAGIQETLTICTGTSKYASTITTDFDADLSVQYSISDFEVIIPEIISKLAVVELKEHNIQELHLLLTSII